ncbi:S8 family serine peptidase [Saccharomonospora halophila]|uniref:S8 family serine peptidase n=1 Tax=Saccharomonospora halophila TaxID=129922 RepID=UPI0003A31D82|nr:S8 family serine peptidase [Saccharomonospora halophila]
MRLRAGRGPRSLVIAVSATALTVTAGLATATIAAPLAAGDDGDGLLTPVSDTLGAVLSTVEDTAPVTVLVHGVDTAAADDAVRDAGLTKITSFDRIGVVAASGSADRVEELRSAEGVTYLENNDPIETFASSGTEATRSRSAQQSLTGADGTNLDGSGVGVAVIDTGVDPLHPALRDADGDSRVVRNLKSLCTAEQTGTDCVVDLPTTLDTDTLSLGGHGTHVTGIAAGRNYELSADTRVGGSAPGSSVVSISTGAALVILGSDAALNWVLENHEAPCGADVSARECPPIKVVNNSYGPGGGGEFDPNSATVKLQRALAAEGVVTVWANGNDGGDGSQNLSNPPGQDPTPGVLSVASYNDQGTGTRDGTVSDFSSRGAASEPQSWPDVSAPGENILSACRPTQALCLTSSQPENGPGPLDLATYNVMSGTSMAAPQVTGIVAQLFQADPQATPGEVEHAIKSTAHKYTDGAAYEQVDGYTSSYDKGTGLVDTVAAATALGAGTR